MKSDSKAKEPVPHMTQTKKTADLEVGDRRLYGILIRLGLSVGLLALALALASRFS
jgi:hypothetical protein